MVYKILYVEDQPDFDTIKNLFKKYLEDIPPDYREQSSQNSSPITPFDETPSIVEPIRPTKSNEEIYTFMKDWLPMVDLATGLLDKDGRLGALSLLKQHANEYLLFIIDRDLFGGASEINDIKKAELDNIKNSNMWPGFCDEKYIESDYYSGDLLLEYLCLESKLSKNEIISRFRFFTGNPPSQEAAQENKHTNEDNALKAFLKMLHFTTKKSDTSENTKSDLEIMVVPKDSNAALLELINEPASFYIQSKYREIFNALENFSETLSINKKDHIKNLIKALAYIEGIQLNKRKLEKPTLSLLRMLGESITAMLEVKAKNRYKEKIHNIALEKFFESQKTDSLDDWIDFALGALKTKKLDIDKLKAKWLFEPKWCHKNKDHKLLKKFCEKYRHYSNCIQLIQTIASQEIHHNNRPELSGNRLQLIVYSLCELLLFLQGKCNGASLPPQLTQKNT